jgi:hypothetical protein
VPRKKASKETQQQAKNRPCRRTGTGSPMNFRIHKPKTKNNHLWWAEAFPFEKSKIVKNFDYFTNQKKYRKQIA